MHARLLEKWTSTSDASEGEESLNGYHCRSTTIGKAWAVLELAKNWTKVRTWKYERLHFHGFICVAFLCCHATELLIVKVRRRKLKSLKAMYGAILMMSLIVAIKLVLLFFVESTHCIFYCLGLKQNGTVVAAHCSCVAGQGEACSQVATLIFIYKIRCGRNTCTQLYANNLFTGKLKQWHVPPKLHPN